jgi:hypothetical protein
MTAETALLRAEAYGLLCRLLNAMLCRPDAQRLKRLRHALLRAEWRYRRRREKDEPAGNRTPDWFYRSADAGY